MKTPGIHGTAAATSELPMTQVDGPANDSKPVEAATGLSMVRGRFRGLIARHQLISFFALAYLISWSLWGLSALGGGRVVFLLGGLGPLISAVVVTRLSGRSLRQWLRTLLVWRVSPGYYAVVLLLPIAIYALINVILALLGRELDLSPLLTLGPGYLGTFLMVATVGGGLEEPGWRGFALPHLERQRSPLVATLLVGLAWGVWHVPLYGPAGFVVPLILAFFYTWIYNRTGSILLCLLLHAGFTPAQNLLTLTAPSVAGGGIGDSTDLVILAVYVAAALGLTLATRGRLGTHRTHRSERMPA
jgi:membrane protease YdiL (CAAX protease family)